MTKKVRIENADQSSHRVKVTLFYKEVGKEPNPATDLKAGEQILTFPTDLAEFYVHSGQYLIVSEAEQ